MTFRESDDRIVPQKLENQSSGMKLGNTGEGKAVRISRDAVWAPTVLSDGLSVIPLLYRSFDFEMGVQEHPTLFRPRVHLRVA